MKNPIFTFALVAFLAISAIALYAFHPEQKIGSSQFATVKLFIQPWGSMNTSAIIKIVDGKTERYAFEKIMKDPTEVNMGALYTKLHDELGTVTAKGYTLVAVTEDEKGNPQYTFKK